MPRGEHPNSQKALNENRRKGQFSGDRAVECGKKSGEVRAVYKSLTEDLKERCTPERVAKMNERVIGMAEHGNLRAYEIIRDGLGENPKNGVVDTEMLNRAAEESAGPDPRGAVLEQIRRAMEE